MRAYLEPGAAVAAVAVAMAVGVYVVAVVDGTAGRLAAGVGRSDVGAVLLDPVLQFMSIQRKVVMHGNGP